jgi:hypothetical protein
MLELLKRGATPRVARRIIGSKFPTKPKCTAHFPPLIKASKFGSKKAEYWWMGHTSTPLTN